MSAVSHEKVEPRPIRLLDNHTVNQIAAGEVVERPASAVKELVENSLDAQATQITVKLENAGRSLIEIADNGHGMSQDAAKMALLRHATSKILTAEDLNQIISYGFRGEALPSIASVSVLTLTTAPNESGSRTKIVVEMGEIQTPTHEAGPQGTTIRVENLFESIPARLKFLKTDTTELNQCVEIITKFAVLRPDVAFKLEHHNTILLKTSGSGDPLTALAEVWSPELARALVPLATSNGYATVSGFISPPHLTKPTRSLQWIFVNGRPVRSKTISAAIDQAYRSLTPDKRYPIAVLNIDVNPAELDVNVSPTKSEVKFHREGGIFDVVRRGIKDALLANGMVPSVEDIISVNQALAEQRQHAMPFDLTAFAIAAQAPLGSALLNRPDPERPIGDERSQSLPDLLDGLRVLGQIDQTFIIAENRHNLLIIDQHVAHERILYEMLVNTRGSATIEKQRLLEPVTISVEKRIAGLISQHISEFEQMGFELDLFGADAILVRAIPALGRGKSAIEVLRDLIDELTNGDHPTTWTPTRDDVYIMCSCKMAIKAGDPLGMAEMLKLIEDLAQTENPYLCPHGRPITITWPKGDLRRRFKR